MYLENGNLVIRSAEVKDAEQLNSWWNDGAVMAHAGFPNGLGESLEETIAGIKENEEYLDQRCVIENAKFPVYRIILDTNLKNARAQHVYEKLGFTKLRVNYGSWRDQLGVLQDSVDYEMTREQFKQLKMQ